MIWISTKYSGNAMDPLDSHFLLQIWVVIYGFLRRSVAKQELREKMSRRVALTRSIRRARRVIDNKNKFHKSLAASHRRVFASSLATTSERSRFSIGANP